MDRRQVLAGLSGLALGQMPFASFAQTELRIGQRQVTSISDGHLVLPGAMFFDHLPRAELNRILSDHGVSFEELRPPCNLTLMQEPDRVVLFDAGSGAGFMPSAGSMLASLETQGLAPEDITHVIITHAHPDHLWGILDDFDDLVFPNAEVMIGEQEWAYWTDPATVDTIGEARASFAVGAARRLDAIRDQVSLFNGGDEILPGVMAHGTPGHTPGHMSFEIRDGSDVVMVGGDAIGNHHVAFARPEWPSGTDQDQDLGAKTRVRLLDQLATERLPLMGFHLPGGGLGRVERLGDAYRFVEWGA
ncbi:MBL fold metallo-hydrolase [Roseobacter insulae]|uniref:MBL fold metallo-hydrolase n=1 Tax=Roseobacter insulae TaxID=2859783 RepID=UPI0027E41F47|nr:MBL fold metallo-hydrolase [Roseobacter insulae]